MKVSDTTLEQLLSMTPEEKWELVCGGIKDEGKTADVALLLGSRPQFAKARAVAAARLYREGRVKYIVPSGGVVWDTYGEMLSEADYMRRILLSKGVDEEAIIMENEATTTKENMMYGAIQINKKNRFATRDVMIVTSVDHMKRSLALAKSFLPRFVNISYYPSEPDVKGMTDTERLDMTIRITKGLVDNGLIDDFEL